MGQGTSYISVMTSGCFSINLIHKLNIERYTKWGVSSTSCSWTDENDLQGSVTMDLPFLLTFLEVRLQTQCICGWLNPIATFQISRELVKNLLSKLTSFFQPSDLLPSFLFLFKDSFSYCSFFVSFLCICLFGWLCAATCQCTSVVLFQLNFYPQSSAESLTPFCWKQTFSLIWLLQFSHRRVYGIFLAGS